MIDREHNLAQNCLKNPACVPAETQTSLSVFGCLKVDPCHVCCPAPPPVDVISH